MIQKLATRMMVGFWSWRQDHANYQTIKFVCDDCGKKGLVLRQISVLNLAFWLLLGILSMFALRWIGAGWFPSGGIGFLIWFGSTAVNVIVNKPQCRHCLSTNVRMPSETSEQVTCETVSAQTPHEHSHS